MGLAISLTANCPLGSVSHNELSTNVIKISYGPFFALAPRDNVNHTI